MRSHLPARDHGVMDLAAALYIIRINGHLGATVLCAFPAMAAQQHDAHTVLTGLLDQSALAAGHDPLDGFRAPPEERRLDGQARLLAAVRAFEGSRLAVKQVRGRHRI
jgi:hypothetical protein